MDDQRISIHTLPKFMDDLQREFESTPVLVISIQAESTGKWGMARLWYMWMKTTGDFMARNGCTMPLMLKTDGSHYGSRAFNENDAHDLFTSRWLGVDSEGVRLSWSKKGRDGMRPATRGERFNALRSHEEWATEKGLLLFKPRGSEYEQAEKEQNS